MELYNIILFFTLFSSITALTLPSEYTEFKNNSDLPSIVQNDDSCETSKCRNTECNCCPGYGIENVFRGLGRRTDECKKCNCGKDFDCKFVERVFGPQTKTCFCPTGYSENSGFCKADCKNNPCQNAGSCTVKNEDIVCVCKNLYAGEFCEKHFCETNSDCKNGGSCIENGSLHTCICLKGTEGPFCEKVPSCQDLDCGNEAKCLYESKDEYGKCKCNDPGKTYDTSDKKCKNVCEKISDCKNGGLCYTDGSLHTCKCLIGTEGPFCEKVPNCEDLDCGNEAKCIYESKDEDGKCKCNDPGKTYDDSDKKCKIPKEVCYQKYPECRKTGGTCSVENDEFICNCKAGITYDETTGCNVPNEVCNQKFPECRKTGGTCSVENDDFICNCKAGVYDETTGCIALEGTCSIHKPKCVETGGSCVFDKNKYIYCECPEKTEYKEDVGCQDKCLNVTCQNGGKCIIKGGKATCNCTDNYTGKFCQTDLISIEDSGIHISVYFHNKNSSMNGTKFDFHFDRKEDSNRTRTQLLLRLISESVIHTSHQCNCENGNCKEISGKIECVCYPEYGKYKEGVCKDCECGKGANCIFTDGKFSSLKTKTCFCPEKFVEADGVCVDSDLYNPCLNNSCKNGARCEKNGVRAKCVCLPGYSGELCQYDNCSLTKCQNGGKCEIKDEKAVCICPIAYTGDYCEIDRCSLIKCQNGGKCAINQGEPFCECDDKYIGDFCELDKCSLMKCLNGGKCEIINQKTACVCNDEFTGDFCERNKCSLVKCQNGGKCYIKNGQSLCNCPDKFTGQYCEGRN